MAANPTPITKKQKLTAVFPTRSPYIPIALFIILALLLVLLANPLRALYHQQQAGRFLAEVVPVGANDYGGFACLRPFLTDYAQRETLQTALYYLRKAENYAPKQAHTFYLLGKTLCLLGDYENAIQALQTFSDLRPKNPLGYLEMGFALLQSCPPNGKCSDGLNTYDAWRKAGVRAEDFLALAEKAHQKEDYETALLWYQNAQRMGMELRSTIAYMRYLSLTESGKEEEANQALQTAVEIDRGWIEKRYRFLAWYQYGWQLYNLKEWKKAERAIEIAISTNVIDPELKSNLSWAYLLLGNALANQHHREEAIQYYQKAIEINPKNIWAHVTYGKLIYRLNEENYAEMAGHFDQALKLAKDNARIWKDVLTFLKRMNLSESLTHYCQQAEALDIMDELIEICNSSPG